jgi:hypothetical protein
MPHLARVHEGGPFGPYLSALEDLGAAYVRFAPWFGYLRVVVPEWTKANCSGAGSSWNSTLLDAVLSDFMQAVCAPSAADGECAAGLSVAPQLSTVPAWLYQPDGINRTADFPEDEPWRYVPGHLSHYAAHGTPLVDPSCEEMAAYAARYVSWYCGTRKVASQTNVVNATSLDCFTPGHCSRSSTRTSTIRLQEVESSTRFATMHGGARYAPSIPT